MRSSHLARPEANLKQTDIQETNMHKKHIRVRPVWSAGEINGSSPRKHYSGVKRRPFLRCFAAVCAASFAVFGLGAVSAHAASGTDEEPWTATWSAAPETSPGATQYSDQTLRLIVHTTVGGCRVRVRISNTFGTDPLLIGAAHVALRDAGARIVPSTDRVLLFNRKDSYAVPPGALVVSDPVFLEVPPLADLAVSLYLPRLSTANTTHIVAQQTNYIAKSAGDFTSAIDLPDAGSTTEWDFLTGVEVASFDRASAIVILSDSGADGIGSTPDKNTRWPDVLAKRLQRRSGMRDLSVLNEAITGNRILHPGPANLEFFGPAGLARFDRDVLSQPGAKFLIVSLGLADIGQPGVAAPAFEEVDAGDLIAGHLQFITRAHEKGMRVYGCTLMPFENSLIGPGFYSPVKEATREALNEWIRTSGAYDGIIDFDRIVRDPTHPLRLLPAYDSGDHTHPNDAGYRALGNSIDLNLFRER
jgi:lysophospholipase L1-like esterase